MACLRQSLDFGLKMGVDLTFLGKKADLCTKNTRDMSKKADFLKKCGKVTAFVVYIRIFFTRLAVGGGFGEDILDRKSRSGIGGAGKSE
ncbi:MAG: hypothetical protein ACYS1A_13840 [Planctomycetota bacterium]|jgi:hypothetical protein